MSPRRVVAKVSLFFAVEACLLHLESTYSIIRIGFEAARDKGYLPLGYSSSIIQPVLVISAAISAILTLGLLKVLKRAEGASSILSDIGLSLGFLGLMLGFAGLMRTPLFLIGISVILLGLLLATIGLNRGEGHGGAAVVLCWIILAVAYGLSARATR